MKKLFLGLSAILLLLLIWVPTTAQNENSTSVSVIIETSGNTDALVAHIKSLGGTVKFQYQNAPMVAATLPPDALTTISQFTGVTHVAKDRLMYLEDDMDTGKNATHPLSYVVESQAGINMTAVDPTAVDLPAGYANFLYTGAATVWNQTDAGEGTIVAVVDTGTVPNVCLSHAIVGAPGFPEGYNASSDGIPATDPRNHWHGTHVGGVIASACALDFSADPSDNLYQAIATYLPWEPDFVPVFGQAPEADIYPVKVFPASGAGVPTSIILDGLDHILTLKKDGLLDIDIVNMSLGGPTGWDGRDPYDVFMGELAQAGMMVVTSAGNEGPIPNSVGSPATSFAALSTGALDYATSSRVLYEFLALRTGLGPGQGLVMRPDDSTRVVNYSSRGPLSDGRGGPSIVALGHWNFQVGPVNEIRWAGGTSFASPTVAGAAALLNAYWENMGLETNPFVFRNVLLRGADPTVVPVWQQEFNEQGWGTLDVPTALYLLQTRSGIPAPTVRTGVLEPTILPSPRRLKVDSWVSNDITLTPSQKFDAVFEISPYTSKVTIEVFDIVAPDNSAYAYWPNAVEVHVQSAKRTAFDHPVAVYWYPFAFGDNFEIVIEDGPWTFWGMPWAYQPMEPGLMKLSLIGDYSNEAPVSFKVRVTRENFRQPLRHPVAYDLIKMGETALIPVEVPPGIDSATFDLNWVLKWDQFPTSDIDMLVYDPDFNLASTDGASGNAPERAIVTDPQAGTWYVYIEGYEMYTPDLYSLFVTLE